jgi:hypothetical protein
MLAHIITIYSHLYSLDIYMRLNHIIYVKKYESQSHVTSTFSCKTYDYLIYQCGMLKNNKWGSIDPIPSEWFRLWVQSQRMKSNVVDELLRKS